MLTKRENYINFLTGRPYEWIPSNLDQALFLPAFIPENVARGFVVQAEPFPRENYGGKDWFGIDWVFEPSAGGSISIDPPMEDIWGWEEKISFPDLSAMDWQGCADANRSILDTDKMIAGIMYTGYFERLISFMGFENASMAMIDEDSREDVHNLFAKLTDFYIEEIRYCKKYFNMEYITFHDDWGTQKSTIFSVDTHTEMILPYVTRLVKAAHQEGVYIEQHSCGLIEKLLPNIIASGVDGWRGQNINDKARLIDEYGDRFKFVVEGAVIGADDDFAVKHISELIEKYKDKRIAFSIFPGLPKEQLEKIVEVIHKAGALA